MEGLVSHLQSIYAHNGGLYLVKYLKISLLLVYKHIAGTPLYDSRPLGLAIGVDRSGLPRYLPVILRSLVRQENVRYIRLVASLLNTYKAIKTKYPLPSFESIIHISFVEDTLYSSEAQDFFSLMFAYSSVIIPEQLAKLYKMARKQSLLSSVTAGPNCRPSSVGWLHDYYSHVAYGSDSTIETMMTLLQADHLKRLWELCKELPNPFPVKAWK